MPTAGMGDATLQPADKLKRLSHEIEVQESQIKSRQALIKLQQDQTLFGIDLMKSYRVQIQTCLKDVLAENENLKSRLAEAEGLKSKLAGAEAEVMDKRDVIRTLRADLEKSKSEGVVPVPGLPKDYVAVLIDTTHLRFREDLVSQGYTGGQSAAHRLSESIKLTVATTDALNPRDLTLFVRIMGHNARKLAGTYQKPLTVYEFVRGFNSTFQEWYWVDMGPEVPERMTGALRTYLPRHHCKKVFLGGVSGEAYHGILNDMAHDKIRKVALISGAAPYSSLTPRQLYSVNFADIFETQLPPAATSLKRKATSDLPQPPKPPQPSGTPQPHRTSQAAQPPQPGSHVQSAGASQTPTSGGPSRTVTSTSSSVFGTSEPGKSSGDIQPTLYGAAGSVNEATDSGQESGAVQSPVFGATSLLSKQSIAPWFAKLQTGYYCKATLAESPAGGTFSGTGLFPTFSNQTTQQGSGHIFDFKPPVSAAEAQSPPRTYFGLASGGYCVEYHILGRCPSLFAASTRACSSKHGLRLDPAGVEKLASEARKIQCLKEIMCSTKDCVYGHGDKDGSTEDANSSSAGLKASEPNAGVGGVVKM